MLFKEILKQGQFAIAVEGSETAKNLYKLFKYNQISEINLYHKVLNIGEFYKTIRRKKILKRIGIIITFLPSYLRNEFKKENDIELIRYSNESTLNISTSNIFQKVITKNYLNWLLKCPVLEPFGFFIMHDKRVLGICVLYVQEIENIKIGRIVHLPYLGDNQKIWMKVINKCLLFFKEQKCCYVSGLAHNYNCRKGYISSGFLSITNDKKPLYIRDLDKRLSEIDLIKWHLQFTEGDKAYRDLLK
jgi:hypothetical protein